MDDEGADIPIAEIFNTSQNCYTKMKNVRWKIKIGPKNYTAMLKLRKQVYGLPYIFHAFILI